MTRRSRRRTRKQVLRLVGYVRVSSDEQAERGVSLDAQRERLEWFCKAHDAQLVAVESDNGMSGKVAPSRRPGLEAALAAIRAGDADGLLVLKLDRLSRATRHVLDLVDECARDGWRLIAVNEHLDTATAAGRLVVTVLAALAQMEREQVAERTRFALDRIAREGRARSRRTPFGWRLPDESFEQRAGDRSKLVKNAVEQRILRRMLRLRSTGLGARRIARDLNGRGRINPRTGREWSPQLVQKLLDTVDRRNRALQGV
jgi:DNA invertase Pin-like site-specific DNA recombinase